MKKMYVFLVIILSFSLAAYGAKKKKETPEYLSVADPVIVEDSGYQPLVFQKVIQSEVKGDVLYDAIYKWALQKSQQSTKFDKAVAYFSGAVNQKVKRGEILAEDRKKGIINLLCVSEYYNMGSQMFYFIMIEIKDNRFRFTTYGTKVFGTQTGAEDVIQKTTGMYKKFYNAYVDDYKKMVYELEKIAKGEFKVQTSDF